MSSIYANNPFLDDAISADERVPGAQIVDVLQNIVVSLAILVVIYLFILTPNQVNGPSMRETLHDQDLLFTNKVIQVFGGKNSLFGDYSRGDIVTFHLENQDLIKRVIGVPGDNIRIEGGKVYLNGELLHEKYLADGTDDYGKPSDLIVNNKNKTYTQDTWIVEGQTVTVPINKYFVMGDNRGNSKDSRFNDVQFIDRSMMKGKAVFRIFPFNKIGFLNNYDN